MWTPPLFSGQFKSSKKKHEANRTHQSSRLSFWQGDRVAEYGQIVAAEILGK